MTVAYIPDLVRPSVVVVHVCRVIKDDTVY
jgi:hypothetical protein